MSTTFNCEACFDDEPSSELVLTAGHPLCSTCFIEGVKPDFVSALRNETIHPVKYASTILDINDFASFFTPEFLIAYNIKLLEYAVPVQERLYCNNNILIKDYQQTCGKFLGSKVLTEEAAVICSGCSTDAVPFRVCTKCSNSFAGEANDHTCRVNTDADAFEWLQLGVDYQICPGCRVKVQLSEACNHMTCNMCEAEFCYICGEAAKLGHWGAGMPCPQYGQPGQVGNDRAHAVPAIPIRYEPLEDSNRQYARVGLQFIGREGLMELLNRPLGLGPDGPYRTRAQQELALGALIREHPVSGLIDMHREDEWSLDTAMRRIHWLPEGGVRPHLDHLVSFLQSQLASGVYFTQFRRADDNILQVLDRRPVGVDRAIAEELKEELLALLGPHGFEGFEDLQKILESQTQAWNGNHQATMQRAEAFGEMTRLAREHEGQLRRYFRYNHFAVLADRLHYGVYNVYTDRLRAQRQDLGLNPYHEETRDMVAQVPAEQWARAPTLKIIADTFVNAFEGRFDDLGRVIRP